MCMCKWLPGPWMLLDWSSYWESCPKVWMNCEIKTSPECSHREKLNESFPLITLFTHSVLFYFSSILFQFIIVHMSKWILSIIWFVNNCIILLIPFYDTLGSCTNDNHWFGSYLIGFLTQTRGFFSFFEFIFVSEKLLSYVKLHPT